jgi:hypothetical protein
MHTSFEPILSSADKMPFEVEPIYLKLAYYKAPEPASANPPATTGTANPPADAGQPAPADNTPQPAPGSAPVAPAANPPQAR